MEHARGSGGPLALRAADAEPVPEERADSVMIDCR
jgi:hypothetical protein